MKRRRRRRLNVVGIDPAHYDRSQIKFYAYLIPVALFMGLPILFIFCNAFKPMDELFAYPPRFYVINPTWENFSKLFALSGRTIIPASRYLFNSLLYTATTMVLTVFLTLSAAYCLSKKKFKLKKYILGANDFALMFVSVAVAIPRYFVVVNLGLEDTFWVHVLPLLAMPVGLFLVKQFMDQVPDALIESAQIDGASDYTILRKILFPIVSPALATVALLSFQSAWGSVEASNIYVNTDAMKNFAFYLSTITAQSGNTVAGQGIGAAASLILFVPNLILFVILQSRVMNTMAHSGIK